MSDIAADAYQHARIRTNAAAGNRGRAPMGQSRVSLHASCFLFQKPNDVLGQDKDNADHGRSERRAVGIWH